jgi:hypothetical protein
MARLKSQPGQRKNQRRNGLGQRKEAWAEKKKKMKVKDLGLTLTGPN